jgi:outer membrane phospholipase A
VSDPAVKVRAGAWRGVAAVVWCGLQPVLVQAQTPPEPVPATSASWLLATPEPRVVPGQSFELVVIGSEGDELPPRLAALIELPGGQRLEVALAAAGATHGARRRYLGQWPGEVLGVATLSLGGDHPHASRLIFEAGAAAERVTIPTVTATAAPADLIVAREADAPVEPTALGFHEPMYFVVGGDKPSGARYQLSFRYRLFDGQGVVAETFPLVRGLYFGFTQTSLWDLASDSKPFRDTSFRPSLFYQWKISNPLVGDTLALAAGYEHESNGRDGTDSRSIDTLFARADLRYHLPDGRTYVGVEPKVLTYIDKDDNPDITRYRGYGQLGLRIGRDDSLVLSTILRRGTAGVGSTQFDLSYPLRRSIFSGVGAFVHLQYFNGYGQTLLDYDESRHPQIRVGVSIVR